MKILSYSFALLMLLTVLGCGSKEDVVSPEGAGTALAEPATVVGKWQLVHVQYTSMIAGQPTTLRAPLYQETFEFKADSTFRRTRSNGYVATGTYTFVRHGADDSGILATFDNPELSYHEVPGFTHKFYSSTKGQVYFRQNEPGVLVESYVAFDGPSFIYRPQADQE